MRGALALRGRRRRGGFERRDRRGAREQPPRHRDMQVLDDAAVAAPPRPRRAPAPRRRRRAAPRRARARPARARRPRWRRAIWSGWISVRPSKPRSRLCSAGRAQAVEVLEGVVARRRRRPGPRPGPRAGRSPRLAMIGSAVGSLRRAEVLDEVVGAHHEALQPRMAGGDGGGVQHRARRLHHRPDPGPGRRAVALPSAPRRRRMSPARSTFGSRIASGPAARDRRDVGARPTRCRARSPAPAPCARRSRRRRRVSATTSRARGFSDGSTASSRSRITASAGRVRAFSSARGLDPGM